MGRIGNIFETQNDCFSMEDDERPLFSKRHERELKRLHSGTKNAAASFASIYYCIDVRLISIGDEEFPPMVMEDLNYLCGLYKLTHSQCIWLSILLNANEPNFVCYQLFAKKFNMPLLLAHQYDWELDNLIAREIIFVQRNAETTITDIVRNEDFYDAVVRNTEFEVKDRSNTPLEDVLISMKSFCDQSMTPSDIQSLAQRIMSKYRGHALIEKVAKHSFRAGGIGGIKVHFDVMFLTLISAAVWAPELCMSERSYMENVCNDSFFGRMTFVNRIVRYIEGNCELFHNNIWGLFEFGNEDGIANPNEFKLSEKGKEYFGIIEAAATVNSSNSIGRTYNLTKNESIKEKQLFYDDDTMKQIDKLYGLLQQDNFIGIQKRLADNNMRVGFNVLLYGAAGTGKTETCLQLSRITKRDIFFVEVSNFKDKFVGESEKRIKAIFRSYGCMVDDYTKAEKPIPIMVMNEADAIIGIRKKGAENAVDKMENSIQNIILQEMENIKGILIATTNLTENLDSAFERRFIYKIKYNRPDLKAKSLIWRSNMPNLTDSEITKLAEEFDFSGGEIENVVRKATIENILSGNEVGYEMVKDISTTEKLQSEKQRRAVGFF